MLRRILHNFATRLLTALLSFGLVWLTARYLGAAGRGAISLFVTDSAALLLFIGLVGGSSLIYLSPRYGAWQLLVPAYAWAVGVCTLGTGVVGLLRAVPPAYLGHLWGLSVLQALLSINALLLLGRKRETLYNLLTVLQVALLVGGLWLAFAGLRWQAITTYYYVAYVAYGLPLLLSLGVLWRLPGARQSGLAALRATTRELARHGGGAHLSNIVTFANYRLGYYFVAHYADTRAVGILSVGVALAEALWMIPRSTALIQYVDLVHADDKGAQVAPTLRVGRLTWLLTAAGALALCALPPAVLAAVFGPEFGAARPVILRLAPGIVAMSLTFMCSSYFAGLARYRVNNLAAALGLVVTVAACWALVPRLGIAGVAWAMSLSYATSTAYLLRQFFRATSTRPADLVW